MSRCMVLFCSSRGTIPGISYFTLTAKRHDAWVRALGRDPLVEKMSKNNRVCSLHFLDTDKIVKKNKIVLKAGAIPRLRLGPKKPLRVLQEQTSNVTSINTEKDASTFPNCDSNMNQSKFESTTDKCVIYEDPTVSPAQLRLNEIPKQNGSEIKQEESEATGGIKKTDDVANAKWAIENKELNIKKEIDIEDQEQRLNEIFFKQNGSEIKLEGNETIDGVEKLDDIVDVKWVIENDELNIKNEKNDKDEEHGNSVQQQHLEYQTLQKEISEKHSLKHKKFDEVDINKCDQCEYQTFHRGNLKKHSLKHKNPDQVDMYKCDQCEYQTFHKENLKKHSLKHKNSDEINMDKCDRCEYQTFRKGNLKRHSLKHKKPDEVDLYKCEHCEYQTLQKDNFKKHSLKHKKSDEVDIYKCDQCEYQTFHKGYLKKHSLKHKNSDQVDMYKCDQCEYETIHKGNFKKHSLKHKSSDKCYVEMFSMWLPNSS